MNKDSHLIFEAYKNKRAELLGEAPIGFQDLFSKMSPEEQEQSIAGAKAEFPELSKGKYAIDESQTVQVIGGVVKHLKENGDYSPKLYKDFQADVVAPIVRQVVPTINPTNSKYTARVVYSAMRKAGIIKDETSGMEGVRKDKGYPSEKGKQQLAAKIVSDPEKFAEGEEPETAGEEKVEAQDSTTKRLTNFIFDEIDPVVGAPEQDVITNVQRKVMSSGGLGLEEKSIVSKIKGIINILSDSKVLQKKAGKIIFGSNFEKFEDASGDTSNIGKDPLEIAQGLGFMGSSEHQRYGTGREHWSVQPN